MYVTTREKNSISPKGVFFALSALRKLVVRPVRLRFLSLKFSKNTLFWVLRSFWEQKKTLDKEAERRRTKYFK